MDGKCTSDRYCKTAQLFMQGTGAYTIVKICWLNVHQMVLIQLNNVHKYSKTELLTYSSIKRRVFIS